jgi:hypothetical protein
MAFPPKLIKPYVISFCRSIVENPEPCYVPLEPLDGAEPDSCFELVPKYVESHGGEMRTGWAIWEWPQVIIEAEFHAIWLSSERREIDITPKKIPQRRILFLPDPHRKYEGFQRDNVRKALCKDKDVSRMIQLGKLMHAELNGGELKYYHGPVVKSDAYMKLEDENRNVQMKLAARYGRLLDEARKESAIRSNA